MIGRKLPTRAWLSENAVAERAGGRVGEDVYHSSGSVNCKHCGGNVGNIAEIANIIDVPASTFSRWLRRLPIRADVAKRIRGSFFRVGE